METAQLGDQPDAIAPDGSEVRLLVSSAVASMAHFTLPPNAVSVAVSHLTLDELWYITAGYGEIWRRREDSDAAGETVELRPGVALTIDHGTHFQFRSQAPEPLTVVGTTVPPWPGPHGDMSGKGEVYFVDGFWEPTRASGM